MKYHAYFNNYSKAISDLLSVIDTNLIDKSVELIERIKKKKNTVYIVGNGGSASIASHVSVDFLKVARFQRTTRNE